MLVTAKPTFIVNNILLKYNQLQSYPQVVCNVWITCILQDME